MTANWSADGATHSSPNGDQILRSPLMMRTGSLSFSCTLERHGPAVNPDPTEATRPALHCVVEVEYGDGSVRHPDLGRTGGGHGGGPDGRWIENLIIDVSLDLTDARTVQLSFTTLGGDAWVERISL